MACGQRESVCRDELPSCQRNTLLETEDSRDVMTVVCVQLLLVVANDAAAMCFFKGWMHEVTILDAEWWVTCTDEQLRFEFEMPT